MRSEQRYCPRRAAWRRPRAGARSTKRGVVQQREDRVALARPSARGERPPRRRGPRGPTPAVVGRARQPERRARGRDAEPRADLGDRRHHEVSVGERRSQQRRHFFLQFDQGLGPLGALLPPADLSRSSSAIRLSRGSTTRRAGPRFFGAPASSPRSRAARHVVRCEEYSPSRRSSAPIAPGVLHAVGLPDDLPLVLHREPPPRRLRHHLDRRPTARACSDALIALRSWLALDTKLPGGHCLTHIGREGAAEQHEMIRPNASPAGCDGKSVALITTAMATIKQASDQTRRDSDPFEFHQEIGAQEATQAGEASEASLEKPHPDGDIEETAIRKIQGGPIDEPTRHKTAAATFEQTAEAADRVGAILGGVHVLACPTLDTFDDPLMKAEGREPRHPCDITPAVHGVHEDSPARPRHAGEL